MTFFTYRRSTVRVPPKPVCTGGKSYTWSELDAACAQIARERTRRNARKGA